MCFTAEMSAGLTAIGLIGAYWTYKRSGNAEVAKAMVFFCLMEFLQAVQQWSPALASSLEDERCKLWMNKFLTILGYVHIQFQPYYTNKYFQAFRPQLGKAWKGEEIAWKIVYRLCLAMAALNMLRLALMPATDIEDLEAGHRAYLENSKDWLEGPQLCSYKGSVHLAWSFPLPQATYLMGGMGLHAFLMFVPALCIGGLTELDSFSFLLLTGPVMAMIVAPNTLEQPSTWCFISIGQVCIGAMSSMMQLKTRPALAATRAEDLKEPLIEG